MFLFPLMIGACGDSVKPEPLYHPELVHFENGLAAGNPDGNCGIPSGALPEDVITPDHVIGNGTAESCTAEAFTSAVAQGGKIIFDCGPDTVKIVLDTPAKIFNDANPDIVIDGGGKVVLSGGGRSRILYMNACDEDLHWTTPHCDNQDHPRLTVQNLSFVDADSRNEEEYDGGGAIWVRGGRFKVINSRFFNNFCAEEGPDVGGGAIRVFDQYNDSPVYVVNSTFGGAPGYGNQCANGGALSSIGVNWSIYNSVFSYNRSVGNGGNPAESGTPGGGSGGAIYNDGLTLRLAICGSEITKNEVNAYGAAIFFVSNNHDGTIHIEDSHIHRNVGGSWHTLPGIAMHSDTKQEIVNSVIED